MKKGDVLSIARIAGIMGAKRTSDLIPLCHPLSITRVHLDLELHVRSLAGGAPVDEIPETEGPAAATVQENLDPRAGIKKSFKRVRGGGPTAAGSVLGDVNCAELKVVSDGLVIGGEAAGDQAADHTSAPLCNQSKDVADRPEEFEDTWGNFGTNIADDTIKNEDQRENRLQRQRDEKDYHHQNRDDEADNRGLYGLVEVRATVECEGKTGVEMEALTAASVASLTVYDMCKSVDKGMRIEGLRVVRKEGGKSGTWAEGKSA